jgi:hypothetical protein
MDLKRRKTDHGENHIMNFVACIFHLIVRVTKSRRMRWAGCVAHMGEGKGVYRFWLGGLKEGDHWEDLGVGERIILRWTLEDGDQGGKLDSAGSG